MKERKFDAIKDMPKLLRILGERPFSWKKAIALTIVFGLILSFLLMRS